MDMGGGRSPSPFFGGVLNFCDPGDILTGLRGVLLVVPDVLVGVVMVLGLAKPNPAMVGGGVAILPADSENLSSTSAKNCSSCATDDISLAEDDRLCDQGVETMWS